LVLREEDLRTVEVRIGHDGEGQKRAELDARVPARDVDHRRTGAGILHDRDVVQLDREPEQVQIELADRDRVAVERSVDASLEITAQWLVDDRVHDDHGDSEDRDHEDDPPDHAPTRGGPGRMRLGALCSGLCHPLIPEASRVPAGSPRARLLQEP
jgi:hypothetical protein